MYRINDHGNMIELVSQKTFTELGYRERDNLQEWIASNPDVFGEELLIISKEFDGFAETNERLDLLALDKQGNIVVIENKLDDSGRDVVWQSLKYAAYCSTLTKSNIRDVFRLYLAKYGRGESAEESLSEFFAVEDFEELKLNTGNTQRIIMVAAKFRKEITSAVLWLLNYQLRIQCFKVTPFEANGERYVNFEQIIPVRDVEEYTISMAAKSRSDIEVQEDEKTRHGIRREFWAEYLSKANESFDLYLNVSPSKDNWIAGSTGITGVTLVSAISRSYARVELYISKSKRDENKFIFDELMSRQSEIEDAYGAELIWERLDQRKASRIKSEITGLSYFRREDWDEMIAFMVDAMGRLSREIREPLKNAELNLTRNLNQGNV